MLDLTKDIRSLTEFKGNNSERVETLKGIKRGLDQMKEGQGRTAESFFNEMFDQLD